MVNKLLYIPPLWRCGPTRAMASSFLRFLDHTRRRTAVGRTPLDEWSARRKDLYLTTHNTHNRQTSMPPVGFEPTISASERPQTYALDRAATGTGRLLHIGTWNFVTARIAQSVVTVYLVLEDPGFEFLAATIVLSLLSKYIDFFLGPTQSCVNWTMGSFSSWVKRPELEAYHYSSSAEIKKKPSYVSPRLGFLLVICRAIVTFTLNFIWTHVMKEPCNVCMCQYL